MLSQTTVNPDVKKAVTVIRELSSDERLREQARKRQDALFNEQSALNAERAEGRAENQTAFVNALKDMGMDAAIIEEAVRRAQANIEMSDSADNDESDDNNDDWGMGR